MADSEKILQDQKVVFTGRLASMPRKKAMQVVQEFGGTTPENLTRDVHFLVVGDEGYLSEIEKSRKLRKAEALQEKGVAIQIISESAFLDMLGLESKYRLENKYYPLSEILNIYKKLTPNIIHYLQKKWGLLLPTEKTNTNQYFQFKDLLYFRRINTFLSQGKRLSVIARAIQAEISPSKQLKIEFEEEKPKGKVLTLAQPESELSAEQWYETGTRYDTEKTTFQQAIEAYENALRQDPDYFPAVVNLGNVYFEIGQYARAKELYLKADTLSPKNYKVLFNLGNLYDEIGSFDQALNYFKQAIAEFPLYADAHFNIAVVYEKLGMISRAREHWEKYLQIDASGEWAEIAREHLTGR